MLVDIGQYICLNAVVGSGRQDGVQVNDARAEKKVRNGGNIATLVQIQGAGVDGFQPGYIDGRTAVKSGTCIEIIADDVQHSTRRAVYDAVMVQRQQR